MINLDLNNAFASLAADFPRTFHLFMANQQGDFLIHPVATQTFGFDRGQSILMQDEFPETHELIDGRVSEVLVESHAGRYADAPLVAAFLRDTDRYVYGTNRLFVGVGQPLQAVLSKSNPLGRTIILIVSGVGLAGILMAVALARYVTTPINRLNDAVQNFSATHDIGSLPVQRSDELGQLARNFLVLHHKIQQQFSELQQRQKEVDDLARRDTLTDLPNRRLFLERLDAAIARARRSQQPLALLFIDLDKFKRVNDCFGHEAGDLVLRTVASRLATQVRETDTVARLAGDEFVVLLEHIASIDKVKEIAAKMCSTVNEPVHYSGQELSVSMSVGIALYPQDGQTLDALINNADRAMYQAKLDPLQRVYVA